MISRMEVFFVRHNLNRFLRAQKWFYDEALKEIKEGKKVSHWIWFVFPQLKGLGTSTMSEEYGIKSRDEAKAYYDDIVLGSRLREATRALLKHKKPITEIMGSTLDARKVRSCMTLFYMATLDPLFKEVIDKFFFGTFDDLTFQMLI